jgi:hypothetical protein
LEAKEKTGEAAEERQGKRKAGAKGRKTGNGAFRTHSVEIYAFATA